MTSTTAVRAKQVISWTVAALFAAGFFWHPLGVWTGPMLGLWFVGTQKPLRGFEWLMALSLAPLLLSEWSRFRPTTAQEWAAYVGWLALASLVAIAPLVFHRLTSPSLPGVLATLPYPMAYAALQMTAPAWMPASGWAFLARVSGADVPLLKLAMFTGVGPILFYIGALLFLAHWVPSIVVWMWTREFRAASVRAGLALLAAVLLLLVGGRKLTNTGEVAPLPAQLLFGFLLLCLGGVAAVSVWALVRMVLARGRQGLSAETLAILESPHTHEPLHLEGQQTLVSDSGERFPIRGGIVQMLTPQELTGDNKKYNRLYETIGGFYDDVQRVGCAMGGIGRDAYVMSYLGLLEVKAGDRVLETSVGTGLNFKYLPRGVELVGLDLSASMLANCQANLRRWQLQADLVRCNAETLPFADSCFDVVFHVGGINFFNDRAQAIREMIRVARPGSRLLIADETEEHVKAAYERGPVTSGYYRNRREPVKPPVDLLPPDMQEVHLEILNVVGKNRFYALTFRKPLA